MKPLIENMGLDWKSQYSKLKHNKTRWSCVMINAVPPSGNQTYKFISIPLRKLTSFLATISPAKVKNELWDKISSYQNECAIALWYYWKQRCLMRSQKDLANERPKWQRQIRANVKIELLTEQPALPAPSHPDIDPLLLDLLKRVNAEDIKQILAMAACAAGGVKTTWYTSKED